MWYLLFRVLIICFFSLSLSRCGVSTEDRRTNREKENTKIMRQMLCFAAIRAKEYQKYKK